MPSVKPTAAEVGARIVTLREQLGLDTAELAASADGLSPMSEERLRLIEAGDETATVRELLSLAWTLRCSLAEFLGHRDGAASTLDLAHSVEAGAVRYFDPESPI